MSIAETLAQLEDKYYGELEEDRNGILPELKAMHQKAMEDGTMEEFKAAVMPLFGGAYIPNIFWSELAQFEDDSSVRKQLFETIHAFAESGFEDVETKKMRSLLITYFAKEKEFEIDRIKSMIVEKAHPSVQEYFEKLFDFTENNQKSVSMYLEKFDLLKTAQPDFELIRLPVMKLRDKLAQA